MSWELRQGDHECLLARKCDLECDDVYSVGPVISLPYSHICGAGGLGRIGEFISMHLPIGRIGTWVLAKLICGQGCSAVPGVFGQPVGHCSPHSILW